MELLTQSNKNTSKFNDDKKKINNAQSENSKDSDMFMKNI
jgi:hypothetical protein